jgi:hypothetical protein
VWLMNCLLGQLPVLFTAVSSRFVLLFRRCCQAYLKATSALISGIFEKLVPNSVLVSKHPSAPAIAEALNPRSFAVRADKVSYSIENGVVCTVRLCCAGTRDVYCVSAWRASEFLASMSPERRMPPLKNVAMWLKCMTPDVVQAFLKFHTGNIVWQATLGPQDALVVPVGFIVAERVGTRSDLLGIRTALLRPSDLSLLGMWDKLWISQSCQSEVLSAVIDTLTLLDQ